MNILAIDQGTSGTKAIVVEESGTVRALSQVPVHPEYLADGGVEQDPAELLASVLTAGGRAARASGGRVDAVALANQGETVLAWDPRSGAPLSRAIVWQDRRSEAICAALARHAGYIAERTGLVLDPYFSAPKMAWLRGPGHCPRRRHHDGLLVAASPDRRVRHRRDDREPVPAGRPGLGNVG